MKQYSSLWETIVLQKKVVFYFLLSVAFILLSFINSYLILFALLIDIFALFRLRIDEYTILLVALMPWAYVYKLDTISTSLFSLLVLISAFSFLLKERSIHSRFLIPLLVFSLFLTLHLNETASTSFFFTLIKQVGNFLLLYFICRNYSDRNLSSVVLFFVISVIISSTVALTFDTSVLNNRIHLNEHLIDFTYMRFNGLQNDPNYYNSSLVVSLLFLFFLYVKRRIKILFFVLIIPLVYFGLLTYSKSFFLLLALWLLIIVLYSFKEKKYGISLLLFALSISLVFIAFSGRIQLVNTLMSRFFETQGDITTGRTKIWSMFFNYIWNNTLILFFGNGFVSLTLNGYAAHNSFIDILYYLGIFGTLLFFYLVWICFKLNSKRLGRKSLYGKIFFAFVLLIYSSISGLISCEIPFMLFFCYILLEQTDGLPITVEANNSLTTNY